MVPGRRSVDDRGHHESVQSCTDHELDIDCEGVNLAQRRVLVAAAGSSRRQAGFDDPVEQVLEGFSLHERVSLPPESLPLLGVVS